MTPLVRYIALLSAAGCLVIGSSVVQLLATPYAAHWIAFGVLGILAGLFALKIPGVDVRVSVSDTFFITSALLWGPAPATVTIAIDSLVMSWRRRYSLERILFNASSPALSLWAGAQIFFWLIGTGPLYGSGMSEGEIVLPLACFAGVYFALNSGLTATVVGLHTRTSPLDIWRKHFAIISLNHLASGSAAFFLIVVMRYVTLTALLAVVPVLVIFQLALRSWLGRLDDAKRHIATIDRLYLSTIGALSTAIEAKDGVTSSHIRRVQTYALGLARELGVRDEASLKAIEAAALLHDTGKLAVPEHILNKPGKLTPAEYETMKLHVDVGADILSSIDFPYPVVPIVRCHHENWDGSGYPRGVKGEQIPLGARVLSVVDCYDALTSDRPYRPAMSDAEALEIIVAGRGTMYDPVVVDTFLRVYRDIAPATPDQAQASEVQQALQRISRSASDSGIRRVVAAQDAVRADAPEELLTLVNLVRVVEGQAAVSDVAALAWSHVRHVVPRASAAFFVHDAVEDAVVARFVTGEASDLLENLSIGVSQRLTGWVAAHRQVIFNSDAMLDLGPAAREMGIQYCFSMPLQSGTELAGVLTLYSAEAFTDDQSRTLQMVAPLLGQLLSRATRAEQAAPPAAVGDTARPRSARGELRVVASR